VTLINKQNSNITLTSSPNPGSKKNCIMFTATVKGVLLGAPTPTGTVTFDFDDCTPFVTLALDSTGLIKVCHKFKKRGSFNVRAIYNGDVTFNVSSTSIKQIIKQ